MPRTEIQIVILGLGELNTLNKAMTDHVRLVGEVKAAYAGVGAEAKTAAAGVSEMAAATKAAATATVEQAAAIKKLEDANKRAVQSHSAHKEALAAVGNGLLNVSAGIAVVGLASARMAADFDKNLNKVRANTTMSDADFKAMEQTVRRLGRELGATFDDVAQAFEHVANFGYSGANAIKLVEIATRAAVATGGKAAETGQLLARVMHEFAIPTQQAGATMDKLWVAAAKSDQRLGDLVQTGGRGFAMAAKLGFSFDETAAALSTMTAEGLKSSDSLTQLVGQMNKIVSPTKEVQTRLAAVSKATGVDLVNDFTLAGVKSKQLSGIFGDVREAANKLGIPVAQLAKDLFPNLRGTIGALIGTSDQGITGINSRLKDFSAITRGQASPITEKLNGTLKTASNEWDRLSNTIRDDFLPVGRDFIKILRDMEPVILATSHGIAGVMHLFTRMPSVIQDGIVALGLLRVATVALGISFVETKTKAAELLISMRALATGGAATGAGGAAAGALMNPLTGVVGAAAGAGWLLHRSATLRMEGEDATQRANALPSLGPAAHRIDKLLAAVRANPGDPKLQQQLSDAYNQATRNNGRADGFQPEFGQHLHEMIAASGGRLHVNSGFRSPVVQQRLWEAALAKYGSVSAARKWVAPPGHSKHGEGLAADLGGDLGWAHKHAGEFGLTFPLSNEAWHIEPVGARSGQNKAAMDRYTSLIRKPGRKKSADAAANAIETARRDAARDAMAVARADADDLVASMEAAPNSRTPGEWAKLAAPIAARLSAAQVRLARGESDPGTLRSISRGRTAGAEFLARISDKGRQASESAASGHREMLEAQLEHATAAGGLFGPDTDRLANLAQKAAIAGATGADRYKLAHGMTGPLADLLGKRYTAVNAGEQTDSDAFMARQQLADEQEADRKAKARQAAAAARAAAIARRKDSTKFDATVKRMLDGVGSDSDSKLFALELGTSPVGADDRREQEMNTLLRQAQIYEAKAQALNAAGGALMLAGSKLPDDYRGQAIEASHQALLARKRAGDMPLEDALSRRDSVRGDLVGSGMDFFSGRAGAGQIVGRAAAGVYEGAQSEFLKKFFDPLAMSITKQHLSTEGNTKALEALNNTLLGKGSGSSSSDGLKVDIHKVGGETVDKAGGGGRSGGGARGRASLLPGKGDQYAGYALAGLGAYQAGQQGGITLGGVLGSAAAGASIGGPIGAAVGVGLNLLGGLFGGGKKTQDKDATAYNAPGDFDYWAYRYRSTGKMPSNSDFKTARPDSPNPIIHVYVDGVQKAVRQEVSAQTGSGALSSVSAFLDLHAPI